MEPTRQQMNEMTSVMDVLKFVGLVDVGVEPGSEADVLLTAFGIRPEQAPRLISYLSPEEYGQIAADAFPAPSPATKMKVRALEHVVRLMAGQVQSAEAQKNAHDVEQQRLHELELKRIEAETLTRMTTSTNQDNPGSSSTGPEETLRRKVKLTAVSSQVDDTEIPVATNADMVKGLLNYQSTYGKDQRPKPDADVTQAQIAAIKHLVKLDEIPNVDFAIWTANGMRTERRMKFTGRIVMPDGTVKTMEIYGPPTLEGI